MSQSQQLPPPRRPVGSTHYGSTGGQPQDELHMAGVHGSTPQAQTQSQPLSSPRNYSHDYHADYAPQIKLDQGQHAHAHAQHSHVQQQHQSAVGSVPNVLQPGGMSAPPRPCLISNVAAPTAAGLPPLHGSMQASAAPKASLAMAHSHSHSYSRSSPITSAYDASSPSYHAYTPTTPSGGPSQFASPSDASRYGGVSGPQRTFSNTPLGLADIRPRADSTMSDSGYGANANDGYAGPSSYLAPWAVYAFDWCKWPPQANGAGKVAVGSYLEDGHNFIQILDSHVLPAPQDSYTPGTSKYSFEFTKIAEATHSYPVTRLLWEPPSSQKQSTDLLATSGDHLRLWSLPAETSANPGNTITRSPRETAVTKLTPLALLSNSKTPDHTAPLTSLDWNTVSPSLIITSSIDTTCTIWDIPSLTAKTQLIAHDKEVYDVRFCANSVDVFVSCGQDGSVRMFDLRSLEHSTIIYEPTGKEDRGTDNGGRVSPSAAQQTMTSPPPLLRLATSPHDTHLLATFAVDSSTIRILDVRQPGQALLELRGHTGPINCLEWSPLRRGTLVSGADDCQVLVWDLLSSNASSTVNGTPQQDNHRTPIACWECDYEIGNLAWAPPLQSPDYGEWLGVSAGRGVWSTRLI
ncbi:hypothetical protein CDD81_2478 [Ophiocordyceps australis]|uniref:Uncharacterized protein n=1 Tax=Ophiocordyceps australis TaxID=1399860 RepID=A0A2C5YEG6_9HYPO|nr:hypothetical protein CDD81_2478 [Ophiocordyceps australis]